MNMDEITIKEKLDLINFKLDLIIKSECGSQRKLKEIQQFEHKQYVEKLEQQIKK